MGKPKSILLCVNPLSGETPVRFEHLSETDTGRKDDKIGRFIYIYIASLLAACPASKIRINLGLCHPALLKYSQEIAWKTTQKVTLRWSKGSTLHCRSLLFFFPRRKLNMQLCMNNKHETHSHSQVHVHEISSLQLLVFRQIKEKSGVFALFVCWLRVKRAEVCH